MKVIVSLFLSAVMLNLSVHAGSSRKQKHEKSKDNDQIGNTYDWEKEAPGI